MDHRRALSLAARIVRRAQPESPQEEIAILLRRLSHSTCCRSRRAIRYSHGLADRLEQVIRKAAEQHRQHSESQNLSCFRDQVSDLALLLKSETLIFDHKEKRLVHKLGNITLSCDSGDVDLGMWELQFPLPCKEKFDIEAVCVDGQNENDGYFHPHVSDGSICFGDAALPTEKAVKELRFGDAIELCKSVLLHYSSANPYRLLEEWLGVKSCSCGEPCSLTCHQCGREFCSSCGCECECGNEACDEHSYTCECGTRCCDECYSSCELCGGILCPGCRRTCSHCGRTICGGRRCGRDCNGCCEHFCRRCLTECSDCSCCYCENCLEDGTCSECREQREQEAERREQEETEEAEESEVQPACE